MRKVEIKHFNSYLYFYYINNGINFLTVIVDLNKMLSIVKKGQSYIELPKKLQDNIKQIERHKRIIIFKGY